MILLNYITGNKIAFLQKVEEISKYLGIKPNWLMMRMWMESRLNPKAHNRSSNSVGLIQFMPKTLIYLGWNKGYKAFADLSNIEQLDYVKKYYKPYRNRIHSFEDLSIITFFPIALGRPDSFVLQSSTLSDSEVAMANKSLDLNNDGKITVGEYKESLRKRVPLVYHPLIFDDKVSNIGKATMVFAFTSFVVARIVKKLLRK